jgi:hypothetical protein
MVGRGLAAARTRDGKSGGAVCLYALDSQYIEVLNSEALDFGGVHIFPQALTGHEIAAIY